MAVYTVENTAFVGQPVRVWDAEGVEIRAVRFCDTVTGRVERWERDPDFPYDIHLVREFRSAPLRVEPLGGPERETLSGEGEQS